MVEKIYCTLYLLSETLLHVHINHVWDDLFLHSCWPILLVFGLAEWKKICFLFHLCKKELDLCSLWRLYLCFVPNLRHFCICLSSAFSLCCTLYKISWSRLVQVIPSVCFPIHLESSVPTTRLFHIRHVSCHNHFLLYYLAFSDGLKYFSCGGCLPVCCLLHCHS